MTKKELEQKLDNLEIELNRAFKRIHKDIENLSKDLDHLKDEQKPFEFKVGDRVQFKTWEEMEEEFGLDDEGKHIPIDTTCFSTFMKHLCGTFATIKSINGEVIELKDFSTSNNCWCYRKGMVKFLFRPTWEFTKKEVDIFKVIPKKYNFVARDRDGEIYFFGEKPKKANSRWFPSATDENCKYSSMFEDMLPSISWDDKEPCEFRKFI